VLGLPWSIDTIGAGRSFVLLISAQILTGFLWDFSVNNINPSLVKLLGGILAIAGSILVVLG
jgi:uncharacterized membrane protein YdcZ (DUF606 family)